MNQVIHHQESQAAQYALRDQAIALKWRDSTIKTIDTDLGRSAATTDGREGFQTLVTGESEKVSATNGAVGWT